jgi:hypothetical protein
VFPQKLFIFTAIVFTSIVALTGIADAQPPAANPQQPPVKVNVINVCTPAAEEQKELSSALAKVPQKPAFAKDFEVARGHSTLDENTPVPGMEKLPAGAITAADWVRVRREFPNAAFFSNVQYSFSQDSKNMVETLVLRVRDPKDLMQISIEDSASAVVSAASMLSASTPISRVKLERFGKASVVLAKCSGVEGNPETDQSAYEPIFHAASGIMERYRDALGARKMVPGELARVRTGSSTKSAATTTATTTKKNR